MRFQPSVSVLFGGWLCLSGAAAAEPGEHIRAGAAEITPAVSLEGAYRSNVYLQEGEIGGGVPVTPGALLSVRPTLGVKVDSDTLVFALDAGYNARKYLNPDLSNLDRFNFFDIGAGASILPKGMFGLVLRNDLMLSGRETEATTAADAYILALTERASGKLVFRPGSSMELGLGGALDIQDYNTPGATNTFATTNLNSRFGYGGIADLQWRFFPRTALVADAEWGRFTWQDNILNAQGSGQSDDDLGDFIGIPDGRYWRATAGLRGRFTEKLVLGVGVGYGVLIYDEQSVIDGAQLDGISGPEVNPAVSNFGADLKGFPEGLLLRGDLAYEITPKQKFVLGYARDFQDVFWTNYVQYHRFTVAWKGTFADRVTGTFDTMIRREAYGGEATRDDNYLRSQVGLALHTTKWLDVTAGQSWQRRSSVGGVNPSVEFDDFTTTLGLRATY